MIWKRTRQSHSQRQDQKQRDLKQADLDMVKLSAAVGEIDLFYLDESGFCMWTPSGYSYFFRGKQKRLEQTKRRGRRLSILGLWQPSARFRFTYGLAIGSFTARSYIKMMDQQAKLAQSQLRRTGKIRVIVQDNGSIHKSQKVQQKWSQWEAMGLYLFFLPPYCSEMNPIEVEWHQIKAHELVGQMFEDELDLAYAVISGVEARAVAGGYSTERFRFNSS